MMVGNLNTWQCLKVYFSWRRAMRHFHLISWKTVWFGSVSSEPQLNSQKCVWKYLLPEWCYFSHERLCILDYSTQSTSAKGISPSWQREESVKALPRIRFRESQVANWWRTLSPLYKAPNQFWVSDTNISGFVRCSDFQPSPTFSDFLWKVPSNGPLKKTAPSQRGSFSRPTT